MDTTEDVSHVHIGSKAAIHEQHDAVDDASHVRDDYDNVPKRAGAILFGIEHHRHRDAVFCHRLGISEF